jgi:DeoR/GlpR family transcriptional regulator of sugar metabolism
VTTTRAITPPRLGEARRELIRTMLLQAGAVTVAELRARFAVSPMTARRDLVALERRGLARRTHGGAVLPSVVAQENSFSQRLGLAAGAKERLAEAAMALVRPGETVFLDSSSTTYYLACRIAREGMAVRVLTNSGPIMDVIAGCEHEQVELFAIGGKLRRLTGSYVGPSAVRTIQEHYADRTFLSVMGIADRGTLVDGDLLEAEVKRAMIGQAGQSVLLVDDSKLTARGRQAIVPLRAVSHVLVDGLDEAEVDRLRSLGAVNVTTL